MTKTIAAAALRSGSQILVARIKAAASSSPHQMELRKLRAFRAPRPATSAGAKPITAMASTATNQVTSTKTGPVITWLGHRGNIRWSWPSRPLVQ